VAHGDGAGTWVQLCTCQVMAALLEILYEVSIVVHDLLPLRFRNALPPAFIEAAHHKELHDVFSTWASPVCFGDGRILGALSAGPAISVERRNPLPKPADRQGESRARPRLRNATSAESRPFRRPSPRGRSKSCRH